jgi:hypothetical protein
VKEIPLVLEKSAAFKYLEEGRSEFFRTVGKVVPN